ncbi:MAG: hypothetical protein ABI625_00110 [bacterium]
MTDARLFINGMWRDGSTGRSADVINPATEDAAATDTRAGAPESTRSST